MLPPVTNADPSGPAPALRRGLAVLRLLASRPSPVSAGAIARDLGLPRSTTYELLTELAAAGFAVHLPAERRWGLGVGAFEIGSAYLRTEPLERLGRPILLRLAAVTRATAHLGVLHGAQTLYLVKEKPPGTTVTLVTDVGIRLPAALTATGLSILANLPARQVRALLPDAGAFVDRTGRGPANLPELRSALIEVRRRGWADEDGQITPGAASVAAAVFDHNAMPIAAIGITVAHSCPAASRHPDCSFEHLVEPVQQAVGALTAAIGGRMR
ncbi:IclR family transcriptional regulator [Nakamurella panacisegetis]|uniref:IclR family transcriptional regulator n=1 Tax=Nakamurella panacisegetis TaxID=1090615 RepID=UPI001E39D9F2|nr:IclR family transcriptional regulator [Nakamurella panacisegetis]